MTSDDHPSALTPDMVRSMIRTADVDTLTRWEGPFTGDAGSAYLHLQAFGQLALPIVANGEVIAGQEYVQAEVTGGQFNGQLAVLDLTELGWPRERLIAAAIGLSRIPRLATTDDELLTSLLQEIASVDDALLLATGYDGDDLDAMLGLDEPLQLGPKAAQVITCPSCSHTWTPGED